MNNKHKSMALLTSFLSAALPALGGSVVSSLEQFNYQTGPSSLVLRSYDAFDEIASVDEFPGVTGLSVRVNGGPPENVPFNPMYDAFKRRQSWSSVADMVAARPVDAVIEHTLQGSPAGTVTIDAPGIAYASAVPASPIFRITGVSGYWTTNSQGQGTFNFNPAWVSSFTVRMNAYSASTQGPHFFSNVSVGDMRAGVPFYWIDEQSSDLLASGEVAQPLSMTFVRGLPADAGDDDPSTFGFSVGSGFLIEGEFGNVFGFGDAGLGEGSVKAFVYQNNTSLQIRAVPEPSTVVLLAAGVLMVGGLARSRQSRGRGRRALLES